MLMLASTEGWSELKKKVEVTYAVRMGRTILK
jgi:hypothetical protein